MENLELEGINKILDKKNITVLGIETSCDETAVSMVSLENGKGEILANKIIAKLMSILLLVELFLKLHPDPILSIWML